MSIRSTSTTQMRQTLLDLQRTNERLTQNNTRIASGQRLTTPADDPAAAATILDLGTSIQTNAQFIRQADAALSFLKSSEDAISAAIDANMRLQELTVSGNAASTSEIDAILANLVSLANTQVQGKYLFAGAMTTTKPFAVNPAATSPLGAGVGPMNYSGDQNSISLDVTTSTSVTTNVNGVNVFYGPSGQGSSSDFFAVTTHLRDALAAGNTANVQQAATDLQGVLGHLSQVRSDLGGRQAALLSLKDTLSGFNVSLQDLKNTQESTDYPATITQFTSDQTMQSATLSALAKTNRTNLFDYLA